MKVQIRPVITKDGVRYYLMRKTLFGLLTWNITKNTGYETYEIIVFNTPKQATEYAEEMFGRGCVGDYYL